MSFLSRLLGKNKDVESKREPCTNTPPPTGIVVPGFVVQPVQTTQLAQLTVDDVEYCVEYSRSTNGQNMVVWAGPEQTGKGIVARVDGGKVLWHLSASKPESVCVSDSGIVVYCDLGAVDTLACDFTAVTPDGSLLMTKRLGALPNCAAVSADGRFAACQLLSCNSDEYALKLVFFDLASKAVLWKRTPAAGPADKCSIDTTERVVHVEYRNGVSHMFDFSGKFLSASAWMADRVMHLYGDQLLEEVEKRLARLPADDTESRIRLVEALNAGIGRTHSEAMAARLHRKIGEIHLQTGDEKAALMSFDAALALNPKIGVRTTADQLRARLGHR